MLTELKAYTVTESSEGFAAVRFATNSATARREGANELDIDWEGVERCVRSPEFDQYAPGPVPKKVLIDAGWWFECHHCGKRINDDDDDDRDEIDPTDNEVVEDGRRIYCSQSCHAIDRAERLANKAAQAALLELFESLLPGATATRVHVYGRKLEPSQPRQGVRCSVNFTFPGSKYGGGTYVYGQEQLHVANGDIDAFHAWRGTTTPARQS